MSDSSTGFPNLNLVRYRLSEMILAFVAPEGSGEFSALSDLVQDGDHLSVRRYRASRVPHAVAEAVELVPGEKAFIAAQITYDASEDVPEGRLPADIRRPARLLSVAAQVAEPSRFYCIARFWFPAAELEGRRLWYPLPSPVFGGDTPSMPADEIRGLRGIKRKESSDELDYSFILDRPSNKDVHLRLELELAERLDQGLPQRVVERVSQVARRFGLPQPK